jgi:2-aminoadipate transaminase
MEWSDLLADRAANLKPSAIREILELTQGGTVISFAGGLPAPSIFPVERVQQAADDAMRKHGANALQYSTTAGHPPLREWIAAQFDAATADDVQIVSGAQQGLDLIAKCLCNPGDTVALAAPTYPGALRALDPYQVRFGELEVDGDGIVPQSLERALQDGAKLIYVIPNFDNPTGATLSRPRRDQVVELARSYGVPILEDNPYGDIRFEGEGLPHLVDLAPEIVIHTGTFSKSLVPGLRVAWLIAPPAVMPLLRRAKQATDLHTSTLAQLIASEIATEGYLGPHVELAREYYQAQRDGMLEAMNQHFPDDVQWIKPAGGMFIWVSGPDHVNTTEMAREAIAAGVAYVPGSAFYADGTPRSSLRLSYSVVTFEQIDTGIAALGNVLARRPTPSRLDVK